MKLDETMLKRMRLAADGAMLAAARELAEDEADLDSYREHTPDDLARMTCHWLGRALTNDPCSGAARIRWAGHYAAQECAGARQYREVVVEHLAALGFPACFICRDGTLQELGFSTDKYEDDVWIENISYPVAEIKAHPSYELPDVPSSEELGKLASELTGWHREDNGPGQYFANAPAAYVRNNEVLTVTQRRGYDV